MFGLLASWLTCGKLRSSWIASNDGIASSARRCDTSSKGGNCGRRSASTQPEGQPPVEHHQCDRADATPTAGFRIIASGRIRALTGGLRIRCISRASQLRRRREIRRRWKGSVGDPSSGTETLFRPTQPPLRTTPASAGISLEYRPNQHLREIHRPTSGRQQDADLSPRRMNQNSGPDSQVRNKDTINDGWLPFAKLNRAHISPDVYLRGRLREGAKSYA